MSTALKQAAYDYAADFVKQKVQALNIRIDEVVEALNAETKSSAGDKHETGRAMLQLEREKLGNQLLEVEKMTRVLDKVPWKLKKDKIGLGSLVETDRANYFISISAGKFQSDEVEIFCISVSTPIGKQLTGKAVGESIHFNGITQKILSVL